MLDTALRTLLGFAILLALTRLLGKKQLSQLTVFTYITGIVLGEITGMLVVDKDVRVADGVISLALWSALALAVEALSLKSARARAVMNGEPAVVIEKGRILEKPLRRQRMSLDGLAMQLRLQQVFSVTDVEYAILEPNGALTVMKKPGLGPVTKADMRLPPEPGGMARAVVMDGRAVEKNLLAAGYTRRALDDELRRQGVGGVKRVLYAELQADGTLHVQEKG
ncbi:MAG: DUF421 domain-containing protein [Oscillospiraceae bacterium]|nr:DUF421 domain-containing protein [Oscillospiraceae bacterium]